MVEYYQGSPISMFTTVGAFEIIKEAFNFL